MHEPWNSFFQLLCLICSHSPYIFYFSSLTWPEKEATCHFNPIKPLQAKILKPMLQKANMAPPAISLSDSWYTLSLPDQLLRCWVLWTRNYHNQASMHSMFLKTQLIYTYLHFPLRNMTWFSDALLFSLCSALANRWAAFCKIQGQ